MPEHDENDRPNRPRTTDPDASAGWREEYAAQGVDAAIAADGGEAVARVPGGGGR